MSFLGERFPQNQQIQNKSVTEQGMLWEEKIYVTSCQTFIGKKKKGFGTLHARQEYIAVLAHGFSCDHS